MFVIWLNYVVSILWAYVAVLGLTLWLVNAVLVTLDPDLPIMSPMPGAWGTILSITYLLQAVVSVAVDSRFERGLWRVLFWIVWFPLAFWIIQAFTAVVGLPKAIFRQRGKRGVWISPDRGFT